MFVSIAMCTHNGAAYLDEQLESLLAQSRLPDELVVCDDVSTDSTLLLLQAFQKKAPFPVTIKQNTKRLGTRENFDRAISLAKGDIIFLADQDDVWKSIKIAAYLDFFSSAPDTLLLFSDGDLIDENSQSLQSTLWQSWGFDEETRNAWDSNDIAFYHLIRNNNKVTGATVAFRSGLKEKALPLYTQTGLWHDAWLALVAAGMNGLRFMNESFIWYRIHKRQQVGVGEGTCLSPYKQTSQTLGPIETRLEQLRFEKKLCQLFPESKLSDRNVIDAEIKFLETKFQYSPRFLGRAKKILNTRQIGLYWRFSHRPFRSIVRDMVKFKSAGQQQES